MRLTRRATAVAHIHSTQAFAIMVTEMLTSILSMCVVLAVEETDRSAWILKMEGLIALDNHVMTMITQASPSPEKLNVLMIHTSIEILTQQSSAVSVAVALTTNTS